MRRTGLLLSLPALVAFGFACSSSGSNNNQTAGSASGSGGDQAASSSSASAGTGGATSSTSTASAGTGGSDAGTDAPPFDGNYCNLPGAVQFTASGMKVVPGGRAGDADLSFLNLPSGFCAHYFGTVPNTRQLRVAPGGELFVASPSTLTTGGTQGNSSIVAMPDDDHDGYADQNIIFQSGLPSTQGLLFTPGFFFYQDGTKIMRLPYASGDRHPSGAATTFADINFYTSTLHWPKALDQADDGTIYVGNGGDQGEDCQVPHPFHGGIVKLDPNGTGVQAGTQVARGFRNPINIRCQKGHNNCFAVELAKDYSTDAKGREKLVPIRQGDDWGFPCCATKNQPYTDINSTDCSAVAAESDSFLIGNTPFGLEFEPNNWPAPYNSNAFVVLHGFFGAWNGARMVMVTVDPTTGLPAFGSDTSGGSSGAMTDFATGWDDGTRAHGRPSSLTFSSDGRLFVGNDANGVIFWIAAIK